MGDQSNVASLQHRVDICTIKIDDFNSITCSSRIIIRPDDAKLLYSVQRSQRKCEVMFAWAHSLILARAAFGSEWAVHHMVKDVRDTMLQRCGLTIDQILARGNGPRVFAPSKATYRASFSVLMRNDVRRSYADDPSVAVAADSIQLVRVAYSGNLLTITEIAGRSPAAHRSVFEEHILSRRYALRTVRIAGARAFMFLDALPVGIVDPNFAPARGTGVLFHDEAGVDDGRMALRACFTSCPPHDARGWIFDAIEV
jgi:hypothetical protein